MDDKFVCMRLIFRAPFASIERNIKPISEYIYVLHTQEDILGVFSNQKIIILTFRNMLYLYVSMSCIYNA